LHAASNPHISCRVQATSSGEIAGTREPGSGAPEEQLAVAFVRAIRQFKALLGPAGLAGLACLGTVARLGPVRVSALAAELMLDVSTTSRHVSQLEHAGLLAREPDRADRRAALLVLTGEGRARLERFHDQRARMLRAATGSWAPADLAALTDLLNRLADDLDARGRDTEHATADLGAAT
jgi:DNA-binding MarR family transcriptional regulator